MDFHVAVPGPFTYLVHEHARSIIAIQELQQEVTSLLEFRDHVLEALPHLHHHYHSLIPAPTHDPPPPPRPAPPPTTRAEASPSKAAEGVRHPQQQQQQQPRAGISTAGGGGGGGGNSSSSSTGGGKSLSETHSSSAVADSGFSTDKAGGSMGKSSSSSAGEHDDPRWTSVEPEAPLGSAEDELWQLLDVIQRKGTRLRHELERAERAERERLCAGHHAPASDPLLACPRPPPRDYWPHSLPGPSAADLLPPPPHLPQGVALEAEAWAAVERLRQDRQYLVGRVGWAEAEAAASHQRLVDLHGQLLALAGDRRRLEDQVRALRPQGAGGAANTVTITTDHGPAPLTASTTTTTTTTTSGRARRPAPAVTVSVAGQEPQEEAPGAGRGGRGVRSASSVRLNTERDVVLPRVLKVPIKDRTPRPSPAPVPAPAPVQDEEVAAGAACGGRRGSDRVVIERERRAGRADGGLSMPVSLLKGARLRVAPNKQRISAILREKDVLELQRQLLTTVMEAEVLRKQIESVGEEWAAKSAEWESDHRQTLANVTSLKEENSRLRQQLEEGATATAAARAAKAVERREVGVNTFPATISTATQTGQEEEEATHTVHPGPNIKYDVVVHQESTAGPTGRRNGAGQVEKPPRRCRDPRPTNSTLNSTNSTPPLRESAESPVGRDSLGRSVGRGRSGAPHSSRGTPTGTPRSSPAPSITPRICTSRNNQQDPPRGSPLTRSGSGVGGRVSLTRRDSLKAAQQKGTAGVKGGAGGAGGGQKVAPSRSADQGGVSQPRPVREAPRSPRASPRPALTLTPSPAPSPVPSPTPATRPAIARRPGPNKTRLLPHKERGAGARTPSPGTRRGTGRSRDAAYPQELLPHLTPVSPSPSPPASCSSYYDSINSEGPPPSPGPAPDRLMQVEVAFEWSPVNTPGAGQPQAWPPSPAAPWPPDSLEGADHGARPGTGLGVSGRVNGTSQVRTEANRLVGRPRGVGGAPLRPGLASRVDQDLNTRVHQILARIASGGH